MRIPKERAIHFLWTHSHRDTSTEPPTVLHPVFLHLVPTMTPWLSEREEQSVWSHDRKQSEQHVLRKKDVVSSPHKASIYETASK